jgi:hypothetical protein
LFLDAAHAERVLPLAIDFLTRDDSGGNVTGAAVRLVWALLRDRVERRGGEGEPEFVTHTLLVTQLTYTHEAGK